MNSNDRRVMSALIEDEFKSRLQAVQQDPTIEEIAKECEELLQRHRLADKVAKLSEAKATVEKLDKELSVAVSGLRKASSVKRRGRYDGCECHSDYAETLQKIAADNLVKQRNTKAQVEKLHSDKRKLLAKIQIATTDADLKAVAKAAGLV